ncbi:MAG: hypothetical protein U0232_33820 [Thermomicrobiales bacterium]
MALEQRAATPEQAEDQEDRAARPCGEFTAAQRARLIMAAMDTQALEGVIVPPDIAVAAFESALRKPLPDIG